MTKTKKHASSTRLNFVRKPSNWPNALEWLLPPLELSLYESQLYNWRSKQQNQLSSSEREQEMSAEIVRLKCQLAERDQELAILQKAATYFAKRLN